MITPISGNIMIDTASRIRLLISQPGGRTSPFERPSRFGVLPEINEITRWANWRRERGGRHAVINLSRVGGNSSRGSTWRCVLELGA